MLRCHARGIEQVGNKPRERGTPQLPAAATAHGPPFR
jgi:hypothetical protein